VPRHANHDEQIIELRKQGLNCRETAERLSIPAYRVYACMQRNGLVGKFRSKNKRGRPAKRKPAFSIVIIGNNEVIKVMPTSRGQFARLLALLKKEGGEVI